MTSRRRRLSDAGFIGLLLALAAAGAVSGFAGGLFGIGGGIVSVPALYAVFRATGVADAIALKSAIGTSLAVIVVTSVRALGAHRRTGLVDRDVLLAWTPWIALGAALGGVAADLVPKEALAIIFGLGAGGFGLRRLTRRRDKTPEPSNSMTSLGVRIPVGIGAGAFSGMMGLGGGAVGVMAMTAAGRSLHSAVATASGFGIAVAAPGVVALMVRGLGVEGLPIASIGYVSLPAFALMGAASAATAPFGARTAHRTDPALLPTIFGAYIMLAAAALVADVLL